MKLLIITQKVDRDDSILGFFHRWIEEFSKHTESIVVICLYKGNHSFPSNVKVLTLGKEVRESRIQYVTRFYSYIWSERKNYDGVFVHMNQIYVLLGASIWKILHKPIGLWYLHKKVSFSLKCAVQLVDVVFSVAKESFRYETPKLKLVGHGIDVSEFKKPDIVSANTIPVILSVGRVAPVKNILPMLHALKVLRDRNLTVHLTVVGDPIYPADFIYLEELKRYIQSEGLDSQVTFLGKVAHDETPSLYNQCDIFLNLSDTGSVDKVVLEAMACGTRVLTSNEAFGPILDEQYKTTKDPVLIATKIEFLLKSPKSDTLVTYVKTNHNLEILIPKILSFYEQRRA